MRSQSSANTLSAPVVLPDLLAPHQSSDRTALKMGDDTVSYQTLADRAYSLAAHLEQHGVVRGDRVAVFLPKGIAECWAIFGISIAGAIFVPLNPLLKGQQVSHILADCEARAVISTSKLWAQVADSVRKLGDGPVVLFEEELDMQSLELTASKRTPTQIGEDLAAILYTSGSTGRPKGVMLTHKNLLAGARIVRNYLGISANDTLLSILPLSFDYGLNQLLTAVEQGATLVPLNFTFGEQIVQALVRYKVTGLAGVPSVWAILTKATPSLAKTPLPHLRYITNTGGPVPSETVALLRKRLPDTRVFLMYGLTEAFRSTYLDPAELDRRPTSIGKAIPECEVFVVDHEGRQCPPGQPGILVHRGPTVSRGYWRRPEDTARVLRQNPLKAADEGADIVCYSGDLVMTDEEGFIYFVGRDDAMIKSGGYRISPSEVEEAIMAGGLFQQVAVIGLPDPIQGNRVHAIAVLTQTPDKAIDQAPAQCLRRCANNLPGYMVPREIEVVDTLPLSPNGKIDYKLLRAERTPPQE